MTLIIFVCFSIFFFLLSRALDSHKILQRKLTFCINSQRDVAWGINYNSNMLLFSIEISSTRCVPCALFLSLSFTLVKLKFSWRLRIYLSDNTLMERICFISENSPTNEFFPLIHSSTLPFALFSLNTGALHWNYHPFKLSEYSPYECI